VSLPGHRQPLPAALDVADIPPKLARLRASRGSCVGGCATSFKVKATPVGMDVHTSGGGHSFDVPENIRNLQKPTASARRAGLTLGWRNAESRHGALHQPGAKVTRTRRMGLQASKPIALPRDRKMGFALCSTRFEERKWDGCRRSKRAWPRYYLERRALYVVARSR